MLTRRSFLTAVTSITVAPSLLLAQEEEGEYLKNLFRQFDPLQIAKNERSDVFTRNIQFAGVKLKCLMDISPSITAEEYQLQKIGTARALRSDRVKTAISQQGSIIFSLSEFSWMATHRIPWAVLQSNEDIEFVSHLIETMPKNPIRYGTGLSFGIDSCRQHFQQSNIPVEKYVLDISGDGGGNQISSIHTTISAEAVRSSSLACANQGIVCNGITLPTDTYSNLPPNTSSVADYYREYVRTPANFSYTDQYGGTSYTQEGFVIEVNSWEAFEEAMTEKLRLEIMGSLPSPQRLRFG